MGTAVAVFSLLSFVSPRMIRDSPRRRCWLNCQCLISHYNLEESADEFPKRLVRSSTPNA